MRPLAAGATPTKSISAKTAFSTRYIKTTGSRGRGRPSSQAGGSPGLFLHVIPEPGGDRLRQVLQGKTHDIMIGLGKDNAPGFRRSSLGQRADVLGTAHRILAAPNQQRRLLEPAHSLLAGPIVPVEFQFQRRSGHGSANGFPRDG